MRTAEQNEVLGTFLALLEGPTGDGGAKRGRGEKPSWKVDTSHLAAAYRHLDPSRERYDEDSGTHKFVHAAWRLLAVAYQEMRKDGLLPEEPDQAVLRQAIEESDRVIAASVPGPRPDSDAGPVMLDVAPPVPPREVSPYPGVPTAVVPRIQVDAGEAFLRADAAEAQAERNWNNEPPPPGHPDHVVIRAPRVGETATVTYR